MSPAATSRANKPAARAAAALAGYLALTLATTYPLVTQFGRAIPGDGFDGWQNVWNLWWVKVALLEQHTSPWFTSLLYYPTGVGLLFHTLNPFNALVTLPVQLAWGLLPAYNAAAVLGFAVGGLGAYLLARHVLGPASSRLAAFLAGVIFAFAPFHMAHLLGHLQVMSLEWLPFFALYLLRTVEAVLRAAAAGRGRARVARDGLLAAFFLVLVGLCDWYYVLYCLLLSVVVGGWGVWRAWGGATRGGGARPRPSGWAGVAAVGAIAAVWTVWAAANSPILAPMVREARVHSFMVPDPSQSRILSADLLAFVTPQEFHPLWGAWARRQAAVFASTVSEHQVFAGFTVLALVALAAWAALRGRRAVGAARRGAGGLWWAVLAVFFVLALGPVLHVGGWTGLFPGGAEVTLPYAWLVRAIPFMEISRSVSRFDVMVMLALGVLAAGGANWLAGRGRLGRAAVSVAMCLVLFEFWPAPYPMSPPDTPAWYTGLAADARPGAVLNLPANWDRPGYLLYQTVHGKPLTAAYISRDDPRTLVERSPVLQHFRHLGPDVIEFDLGAQGQQVLADLGVRWVVLDRYKMPGGEERAYTEAAAAEVFARTPAVYEDERLTVYEVTEPEARRAYLVLGDGWEPLDEQQRTRAFTARASVIIQAPDAGQARLRLTTAAGSAAPDLPQEGEAYAARVTLQPGANEFVIGSRDPGARITIATLSLGP